jgi:hypothetical protein
MNKMDGTAAAFVMWLFDHKMYRNIKGATSLIRGLPRPPLLFAKDTGVCGILHILFRQ